MATPLPVARQTTTYSPQPAPAPSSSSSDWNNQWNTIFNQAWNAGYNLGSKPSVSSDFNSAVEQGYSAGVAKRPTTTKATTPTSFSSVPSSTPQNVSNGPSVDDAQNQLMNEINNLYGQSESLFSQQETNLGQQKTLATEGVNLQKDQAKRSYDSALQSALNASKSQQNILAQTKQTGDSQAIRNYNALGQSIQSKYGNGSSTGGALQSIISEEFLRNSGNSRQAFTNSLEKIFTFEQDSQKTFQLASQKLEEDTIQMIKGIDQSYNDGLLQISASRTANESAKNAAKVSLLESVRQNAMAIQNYKIQAQVELDTWLTQQKQSANDNLAYVKSLATQMETNTFSNNQNLQNIQTGSFLNNNTAPQNQMAYKPLQNKTNEDEYSGLNPWLV